MNSYDKYLKKSLDRLKSMIVDSEQYPILFIGSGMSKRYFNGPSWKELLEYLILKNPNLKFPFEFYNQKSSGNLLKIASYLVEDYHYLAWEFKEKEKFPTNYYEQSRKDVFLKYSISEYLSNLLFQYKKTATDNTYENEIELLSKIQTYAIITTNYDEFLENIFPTYNKFIGEQIVKVRNHEEIGSIIKIHGCVTKPETLVISEADYDKFLETSKYLVAKLLAFFVEYPLIFLGYSISDSNIKKILGDLSKLTSIYSGNYLPNIWFVEWNENLKADDYLEDLKVIDLDNGATIQVNHLTVSNFSPLYKALAEANNDDRNEIVRLKNLVKTFNNLLRRNSFKLPFYTMESSYETMDLVKEDLEDYRVDNEIACGLLDYSYSNINYNYSLNDVAKEIGLDYWHEVVELIKKVENDTKIDIRGNNNVYYRSYNSDGKVLRRYSEALIKLLIKVKNGENYYVIDNEGKKVFNN